MGLFARPWEHGLDNVRRLELTPVRKGIRNTGRIFPADVVAPAGLPVVLKAGAPVVLAGECLVVDIPIGGSASALHVLGHTTYFDGFPVRGEAGETIARHSRMNPVSVAARRVLVMTMDPDWETYQVNHYVLVTNARKGLEGLRFEPLGPDYHPLLNGIEAVPQPAAVTVEDLRRQPLPSVIVVCYG